MEKLNIVSDFIIGLDNWWLPLHFGWKIAIGFAIAIFSLIVTIIISDIWTYIHTYYPDDPDPKDEPPIYY